MTVEFTTHYCIYMIFLLEKNPSLALTSQFLQAHKILPLFDNIIIILPFANLRWCDSCRDTLEILLYFLRQR